MLGNGIHLHSRGMSSDLPAGSAILVDHARLCDSASMTQPLACCTRLSERLATMLDFMHNALDRAYTSQTHARVWQGKTAELCRPALMLTFLPG